MKLELDVVSLAGKVISCLPFVLLLWETKPYLQNKLPLPITRTNQHTNLSETKPLPRICVAFGHHYFCILYNYINQNMTFFVFQILTGGKAANNTDNVSKKNRVDSREKNMILPMR